MKAYKKRYFVKFILGHVNRAMNFFVYDPVWNPNLIPLQYESETTGI